MRYSDVALCGPTSVRLPGSREPVAVEFYFAPLRPGEAQGSVVLVNDEVGGSRVGWGGLGRGETAQQQRVGGAGKTSWVGGKRTWQNGERDKLRGGHGGVE